MNTPTHLLISAALLARKGMPRRNVAVLAGAIIPDLSMFVLFGWAKLIAGIPEQTLWGDVYWQEPWQTLSAISNSIPLFGVLFVLGVLLRGPLLWLFALSALLHLLCDFPLHNDDAHQHFWPLTDWRFHSPFSYWDGRHYGGIVRILEVAIGVVCAAVLWRRFRALWVKCILALAFSLYVLVPLYFVVSLR